MSGDDGGAEGVRVEIEESDEETTEATAVVAVEPEPSGEPLHSLERLNKKEPRAGMPEEDESLSSSLWKVVLNIF